MRKRARKAEECWKWKETQNTEIFKDINLPKE